MRNYAIYNHLVYMFGFITKSLDIRMSEVKDMAENPNISHEL
jgi:hypothetical protein